jgi:hypothetical protein
MLVFVLLLQSPRACRYSGAVAASATSLELAFSLGTQPKLLMDTLLGCPPPQNNKRGHQRNKMSRDTPAVVHVGMPALLLHLPNIVQVWGWHPHTAHSPNCCWAPSSPTAISPHTTTTAAHPPRTPHNVQMPQDAPAVASCLQIYQRYCCSSAKPLWLASSHTTPTPTAARHPPPQLLLRPTLSCQSQCPNATGRSCVHLVPAGMPVPLLQLPSPGGCIPTQNPDPNCC